MWWVLGILIFVGLLISFATSRKSYIKRQLVLSQLFSKIEEKYELAWNNYYLKPSDRVIKANQEDFVENVFVLIKPEIDAIFDLISRSFLLNLQVFALSTHFKEAALKLEHLCKQKIKARENLGREDLNELYTTFQDCLRANFLENQIRWNLGK